MKIDRGKLAVRTISWCANKDSDGVVEGKAETLARWARAVAAMGRQWWVSGGTALGLVRDGGFIDGDTDIDLCFRGDLGSPLTRDEVVAAFPEPESYALIRTTEYDKRLSQVAVWDRRSSTIVDIYCCYDGFEDGHLWMFAEGACIRKPARFIDGAREVDTPVGRYPMPQPAEEYCAWRYGEGWRVPDAYKGAWRKASPARVEW